ncbi:hypothetical protein BH10CHL1_BH10CHL1_27780 [soil metagenome]
MATRQLQSPSSALHALTNPLLILGQILLLIVAWSIFFLWALLMTESLFLPWLVGLTSGQGLLHHFYVTGIGLYLTPFVFVVISIMLFFYRMPRTQEKVSVSLEFTLTLLVFMGLHLFVVNFALPWAVHCLPVSTRFSFDLGFTTNLLFSAQTCQFGGAGVLFTALGLVSLFWVQARAIFATEQSPEFIQDL